MVSTPSDFDEGLVVITCEPEMTDDRLSGLTGHPRRPSASDSKQVHLLRGPTMDAYPWNGDSTQSAGEDCRNRALSADADSATRRYGQRAFVTFPTSVNGSGSPRRCWAGAKAASRQNNRLFSQPAIPAPKCHDPRTDASAVASSCYVPVRRALTDPANGVPKDYAARCNLHGEHGREGSECRTTMAWPNFMTVEAVSR